MGIILKTKIVFLDGSITEFKGKNKSSFYYWFLVLNNSLLFNAGAIN
jgi:hypothetical protein